MPAKKLACLLSTVFFSHIAAACTDLHLTAKDGTQLIARSMEFGTNMNSNLRTSLRDRTFVNTTPNGKAGLSWKAQYGYVYLDALNVDVAIEGMNEAGLAFEALYLPGETEYQVVPDGQESQGLAYERFGDWVLANFKTVDEVKNLLPKIFVYAEKMTGFGDMIFPLHYIINDNTGKSIVVEYVGGKMNVYDNTIGVVTNSPTYNWHMTNLRNYVNLSPQFPKPVTVNGVTFAATGQGAGMVGLPGDASPPSRFVKVAVMKTTATDTSDAVGTLNLAQHIMNNVDIPLGFIRDPSNGQVAGDYTQWVVYKDLTHKIFYYKTYGNMNIRAVSLDKLNFASDAQALKMPLESTQTNQDITEFFTKQK